jgi:excisionase family DNA binding protein
MISTSINNVRVQQGDRLLLRGGEVAAMLGISRALAFRWMAEGVLPTVRIRGARTVRVPEEALHDWIRANTNCEPMQPTSKLR